MTDPCLPAKNPCGSCPYRRDVPSGVWAVEEYEKLPRYDGETITQPTRLFMCHQQDGRLCAGWVGTHDMEENFAVRLHAAHLTSTQSVDAAVEFVDGVIDYTTEVPLFASGAEAAEHGMREVDAPGPEADKVIAKVKRKQRV